MFSRVDPNRPYVEPTRRYQGDVGYDLYAPGEVVIPGRGGWVGVMLNVSVDFPEGMYGLLHERSSQGVNGIFTVGNVIDGGYQGEIGVTLINLGRDIAYRPGDRIAQLLVMPRYVDAGDTKRPKRGTKGFGSTGA